MKRLEKSCKERCKDCSKLLPYRDMTFDTETGKYQCDCCMGVNADANCWSEPTRVPVAE